MSAKTVLILENGTCFVAPHFLKDFQEFETALTEQNLLFTEREMEKAFVNKFEANHSNETYWDFMESLETTGEILIHA